MTPEDGVLEKLMASVETQAQTQRMLIEMLGRQSRRLESVIDSLDLHLDEDHGNGHEGTKDTAHSVADAEKVIQALYRALDHHPQWCGFSKDAPGHPSFNEAKDAVFDYYEQPDTVTISRGQYDGLTLNCQAYLDMKKERDELRAAARVIVDRWSKGQPVDTEHAKALREAVAATSFPDPPADSNFGSVQRGSTGVIDR